MLTKADGVNVKEISATSAPRSVLNPRGTNPGDDGMDSQITTLQPNAAPSVRHVSVELICSSA